MDETVLSTGRGDGDDPGQLPSGVAAGEDREIVPSVAGGETTAPQRVRQPQGRQATPHGFASHGLAWLAGVGGMAPAVETVAPAMIRGVHGRGRPLPLLAPAPVPRNMAMAMTGQGFISAPEGNQMSAQSTSRQRRVGRERLERPQTPQGNDKNAITSGRAGISGNEPETSDSQSFGEGDSIKGGQEREGRDNAEHQSVPEGAKDVRDHNTSTLQTTEVTQRDNCACGARAALLESLGDILTERMLPLYNRIESLEATVAAFAAQERRPKATLPEEEKSACLAVYAAARAAVETQMADLPLLRGNATAHGRLERLLDGLYRSEDVAVRRALLSIPPLLTRQQLRKHVLKVMAERRRRATEL